MEVNVAGLAIAFHPQNIRETGIGTGTEFSVLNIVNNLQYSHNLEMFMLINHQRWIPSFFKRKVQRGHHLSFVCVSDFCGDVQNTDKLNRKKDKDDLKTVLD